MYSRFQLAKKYLRYYLTASNGKGHGIHSPFVFDFVKNVLNDSIGYAPYKEVEFLRHQLLKEKLIIEVHDMGAGRVASKKGQRKLADIARYAVKPKKYGQLLFRIVQYYQPQTIIELGTSLGLTTCYFAMANRRATVITLEGAAAIAAIAKKC